MGKRFTETTKWQDGWFADLSPVHKLAWLYLLDACDAAGGVDLSRRVANLTIGCEVDWDEFLKASAGRVEALESGKLFLPGFVEFQYGELKPDYNPHRSACKLIEKYQEQRKPRAAEGSPKGSRTLMDQDKDQDKDKDKDKDQDKKRPPARKTEVAIAIPGTIDTPEFRESWRRWQKHRKDIKKPLTETQSEAQLCWLESLGETHAIATIAHTILKGWQGLREPDAEPRAGPAGKPQPKWKTTAEIMAEGAI